MKKSTAFLVICTALAYVFSSCAKETEKESSVSEDVSVSDSAKTETTVKKETTTKTEKASETKEKTESETTTKTEKSTTESKTEKITTSVPKKETKKKKSDIATTEYIKNADPTAFLGKWECEKMIVEGEEFTDLMGIPVYAVFQLEIKADNTASMVYTFDESGDSETYTWGMVSDTEMEIVNEDGDVMVLTVDGGYLVGVEEDFDEQLYFVKVDGFTAFDFEEFMNGFSDSDKSAFLGKWECEKAVIDGEEVTDVDGIPLCVIFQFDFKEDGTVLLGESMAELMEETSYSWSMESKNEITVIDGDGDAMLLTLDDDYLSDDVMYFVRVDEFTTFDIESFMNE